VRPFLGIRVHASFGAARKDAHIHGAFVQAAGMELLAAEAEDQNFPNVSLPLAPPASSPLRGPVVPAAPLSLASGGLAGRSALERGGRPPVQSVD
jgi:hypothetical protein